MLPNNWSADFAIMLTIVSWSDALIMLSFAPSFSDSSVLPDLSSKSSKGAVASATPPFKNITVFYR